jgi:hypothetical protein
VIVALGAEAFNALAGLEPIRAKLSTKAPYAVAQRSEPRISGNGRIAVTRMQPEITRGLGRERRRQLTPIAKHGSECLRKSSSWRQPAQPRHRRPRHLRPTPQGRPNRRTHPFREGDQPIRPPDHRPTRLTAWRINRRLQNPPADEIDSGLNDG